MLNNEQFVKSHWKQTITLVIVVIVVIAGNVILEDTDWVVKDSSGVVKGEATVRLEKQNNDVLEYQNKIKDLVNNYLNQRAEYAKPHQDWLFLINKIKYQALSIDVPGEYKNLHLALIVILDAEKQAVIESNDLKINQVSKRWAELLEQYFWLNQ